VRVGAFGLVVPGTHYGRSEAGSDTFANVFHCVHSNQGRQRHSAGALQSELKDISVLVAAFAVVG